MNDPAPAMAAAAARLGAIRLPDAAPVAVPCQLVQDWPAAVDPGHLATLSRAAAGQDTGILTVTFADREARRALLAAWARQEYERGRFPGGVVYVDREETYLESCDADMGDVVGDLLRLLGVREEIIPVGHGGRSPLLRQARAAKGLLIVLDGIRHAPLARPLILPGALLVVGGTKPMVARSLQLDGGREVALDGPQDSGASPASVHGVLERAVEDLSPDARHLRCLLEPLEYVPFGSALVNEVFGPGADTALRALADAGLVVPASRPQRFRFRAKTALCRLCRADTVPPGERHRMEYRLAEAVRRLVERIADTATDGGPQQRTAGLEALREQAPVVELTVRLAAERGWHHVVWPLALAMTALMDARGWDTSWDHILERGADSALADGAADAHAELRTRLVELRLYYAFRPQEVKDTAAVAFALCPLVSNDQLRARIWHMQAEFDARCGRDTDHARERALYFYRAAGDQDEADRQILLWAQTLLDHGRVRAALERLDDLSDPRRAGAHLVRARAYRASRQALHSVKAAVTAAERAVDTADYVLCGQALEFLAEVAHQEEEHTLLAVCREQEAALRQFAGLAPRS
ncbi:hypothetical protein OK074_5080 [Actinobacteria bacterium OK074]|nr:hypothetical protein OK074_5080 [Actinobacteria bacterium OK074]